MTPRDPLARIGVEPEHCILATPLYLVCSQAALDACAGALGAHTAAWVSASGFRYAPGEPLIVRDAFGAPMTAVGCIDPRDALWTSAALSAKLVPIDYQIAGGLEQIDLELLLLGWWHGQYRCDQFRSRTSDDSPRPRLVLEPSWSLSRVRALTRATGLALDLVNSPPNLMGPEELQRAVEQVAREHSAQLRIVTGDALLEENYPLIHAVGRASRRQPRLLDLRWGRDDAPRITMIGKGVCFDAGGLNLKSREDMLLMKKDMAGAAQALALAHLVMQTRLDVRLRLLIPAVENFVSNDAFRPSDIYRSRKGLCIEIGDTDAEGRLVLADALTEACAEQPEYLIDYATLTGSTTKALGPEIAGFMTHDDDLAQRLMQTAARWQDPVWRLPLHAPYKEALKSQLGDLASIVRYTGAGAILAGLFLAEFVTPGVKWLHLDFFGWNVAKRPGRPVGAETHALRAVFGLLEQRFTPAGA